MNTQLKPADRPTVLAGIACPRLTNALLLVLLCLGAGCRRPAVSNQAENNTGGPSPGISQPALAVPTSGSKACALLTDQEIGDIIGPHNRGGSGKDNQFGLQSCRWTATNVQKEGWTDSIEIQVFNGSMQSWARGQAKGEPVSGLGDGALFDASDGDLWFNCAPGRFCVLKASTWSGDTRQQIARQLAQLVAKRLQ
jgi:hypothetical protein